MSIFENAKVHRDGKITCKCGSIRIKADVRKDDDDNLTWIAVKCAKCGRILFYNGA